MTMTNDSDIYYDPFDIEIDKDPYPLWKRMRDEAPLYYNEKYDFYALSRYDDVEQALVDWDTYRSGKGSTLEIIMAEHRDPAGADPVRGPADPRPAPRSAVAGVHPQEDERDRAEGARVLRPHPRPARRDRPLRLHRRPRRGDADAHDRHAARHPRGGPGGDPRPHRRRPAHRGRRRRSRRTTCSAAGGEIFAEYIDWRAEQPVRRPDDRAAQRRVRGRDRRDARGSPATRCSPTSCCSPAPATRPRPA